MAASQMSTKQKRILTRHSLKLSCDFTPEGVIVLNGWLASGGCFQECWPWPVSLGACVCVCVFPAVRGKRTDWSTRTKRPTQWTSLSTKRWHD